MISLSEKASGMPSNKFNKDVISVRVFPKSGRKFYRQRVAIVSTVWIINEQFNKKVCELRDVVREY
eukprot:scaffold2091_cov187-Chaetoceros_neogracile.AAC.4